METGVGGSETLLLIDPEAWGRGTGEPVHLPCRHPPAGCFQTSGRQTDLRGGPPSTVSGRGGPRGKTPPPATPAPANPPGNAHRGAGGGGGGGGGGGTWEGRGRGDLRREGAGGGNRGRENPGPLKH